MTLSTLISYSVLPQSLIPPVIQISKDVIRQYFREDIPGQVVSSASMALSALLPTAEWCGTANLRNSGYAVRFTSHCYYSSLKIHIHARPYLTYTILFPPSSFNAGSPYSTLLLSSPPPHPNQLGPLFGPAGLRLSGIGTCTASTASSLVILSKLDISPNPPAREDRDDLVLIDSSEFRWLDCNCGAEGFDTDRGCRCCSDDRRRRCADVSPSVVAYCDVRDIRR